MTQPLPNPEAAPDQPLPNPEAAPDQPPTIPKVVRAIARDLADLRSRGDVAELRRLRPGDVACAAFWKITAEYLDPLLPAGGKPREEAERRWAVILAGMAEMHELHAPGRRLGHALAAADVAEPRVLRLLRSHDEALFAAARTIIHQLASKAQAMDWTDMALLILSDGRSDEETLRRRIARDYYAQADKENK